MLSSSAILQLFDNVLNEDIVRNGIREQDIRRAVRNMAEVYAPNPTSLQSDCVNVANYDDVAHRCAYMHKMASFHTALVQDMMVKVLDEQYEFFETLTSSHEFKICSLGGGPGSDVIGVIAALSAYFGYFQTHVTVMDIMEQWRFTFSSLIAELAEGNYGTLGVNLADNMFQWNYIGANLLDTMTNPVSKAISQASLITMVKFVSATASLDTGEMIRKIFRCMKPGALVLFIDNAAGGFHGLFSRAAKEYRFITAFGPLYHNTYSKEDMKVERFGYTSCFMTTVTVHLLCKPRNQQGTHMSYNIPVSPQEQNSNISRGVSLNVPRHHQNNYRPARNANVPVYTHQPSATHIFNNLNARNQFSYIHLSPEDNRAEHGGDYEEEARSQPLHSSHSVHGNRTESEDDYEEDPCASCCVIS